MDPRARVERTSGYAHAIRIGSHTVTVDEPVEDGGTDAGPTPYQLMLGAMASCTAITLELYAERKGWVLGNVAVDCYEDDQREIHLDIHIPEPLEPEQVARLTQLAGKCPVVKSVTQGRTVHETVEAASQ
jgi:putative redox protein